MKLYTAFIVIVSLFLFTVTVHAQMLSAPVQSLTGSSTSIGVIGQPVQIAERLFTAPVIEPNGFIAVCFATNLDTVARDLAVQILDSAGGDVTQTSSCGARQMPGVTCDSTAHFSNNSPLRCVVGTGGKATTLRGGMTTSSGPFPFVSPANLSVPAQ